MNASEIVDNKSQLHSVYNHVIIEDGQSSLGGSIMMKGVTPRGGGHDIKFTIDDDSSQGTFHKVNQSGADGSMYSPNHLHQSIDDHDNIGVSIMSMERKSFDEDDSDEDVNRSEMQNLDHSEVKIVVPQKKAAAAEKKNDKDAENEDSDDSSIIIK